MPDNVDLYDYMFQALGVPVDRLVQAADSVSVRGHSNKSIFLFVYYFCRSPSTLKYVYFIL